MGEFHPMDFETRVSNVEFELLHVKENVNWACGSIPNLFLYSTLCNLLLIGALFTGAHYSIDTYKKYNAKFQAGEAALILQVEKMIKLEAQLKSVESKLAKIRNTGELP